MSLCSWSEPCGSEPDVRPGPIETLGEASMSRVSKACPSALDGDLDGLCAVRERPVPEFAV